MIHLPEDGGSQQVIALNNTSPLSSKLQEFARIAATGGFPYGSPDSASSSKRQRRFLR